MRPRDRLALAGLVLALAAAILPVAGAIRWGALLFAALGLLSTAPYLTSRRSFASSPRLAIALGVMAAATALQVLPLPAFLVGWLSPQTAELINTTHEAAGQPAPSWMALSISPGVTALELAKLVGYTAVAVTALRLSSSRQGRQALRLTVALAGLALVVIAIGHRLMDERKLLFGLYEPITYSPRLLTPFINVNHLSGLLVACGCVFTGMAIGTERRDRRLHWALGALVCVGTSLLVPSRGAAVGLVAGATVLAGLQVLAPSRGKPRLKDTKRWLPIVGVVVVLSGMVAVLGDGIVREFSETSTEELVDENSKFGAWASSLQLIADYPLTGSGRGAFQEVFPPYHDRSSERIYSHVENEYLQTVIDHGVGLGTLILALMGWALWPAARRGLKSPVAAGTVAALAVILTQNFFDFGLALPGTAAPWILLAAAVTYGSMGASKSARERQLLIRGVVTASAAVVLVLATLGSASVLEDRTALREAVAGTPASVVEERAWTYVRRHPADGLHFARVAAALYAQRSPRAFAYLARALDLYPTHAGTRHLSALLLRSAGRPRQALGEYRRAIELAGRKSRDYVREVALSYPDPGDALEALPLKSPRKAAMVSGVLQATDRYDVAIAYTERLIAMGRSTPELALGGAKAAMRIKKPEVAERLARAAAEGGSFEARELLAASLVAQGRSDAAVRAYQILVEQSGSLENRARALFGLADTLEKAGRLPEARDNLKKITEMRAAERRVRSRAHEALARVERQLGNTNRAAWEAARARDLLRR